MNARSLALGLFLSAALAASADAAAVTLTFDGLDGEDWEQPGAYYDGGQGSLGSGPGAAFGITFSSDSIVSCTLAYACDDPEADGMPRDVLRFLDPRASFAPPDDPAAPSVMNVAGGFVQRVSMIYATRSANSELRIWSGANATGSVLQSVKLSACDEHPSPCLFSPVTIDFAGVGHSLEFVDVDFDLAGFDDIALDLYEGTGVPEPATWALMIMGFGLAGAGLRRRRAAFA
jgi:hypothetical protein